MDIKKNLRPFNPSVLTDLQVQGTISFQENSVSLEYDLSSEDIACIDIEQENLRPQKQDELWKNTCFELFIHAPNRDFDYIEFNYAYHGGWNVYFFSAYRERCEVRFNSVPNIKSATQPQGLKIRVQQPLEGINLKAPIKIGLSCVLKINDNIEYWAVRHNLDKPDFHLHDLYFSIE
jgi:hypothetical protein